MLRKDALRLMDNIKMIIFIEFVFFFFEEKLMEIILFKYMLMIMCYY